MLLWNSQLYSRNCCVEQRITSRFRFPHQQCLFKISREIFNLVYFILCFWLETITTATWGAHYSVALLEFSVTHRKTAITKFWRIDKKSITKFYQQLLFNAHLFEQTWNWYFSHIFKANSFSFGFARYSSKPSHWQCASLSLFWILLCRRVPIHESYPSLEAVQLPIIRVHLRLKQIQSHFQFQSHRISPHLEEISSAAVETGGAHWL